ncbi:hypothetical protein EJ06DRAFT_391149 [Neofusicoccum parvum]|uniref:Uncharacterized protein n=1 Tax=Neofusicoccum parvum TaxID=310453 RepID=A0ACB5SAZ2_9PEZI|nr:hypothetical protein EJ06DRAFT_391149 [Neofusicoccum parvum]
MQTLQESGYRTRKEASGDFFQRARVLYDFGYEDDRLTLVQSLVLLTHCELHEDQKDDWHWLGVATSLAQTVGLHRNPESMRMDSSQRSLRKRIWWSLYIRDHLIAMNLRQPSRIKEGDYDVPLLTIDDFNMDELPETTKCIPAHCMLARDARRRRQAAILCIEMAKVCVCIEHVLSKQRCVLRNHGPGFSNRLRTAAFSKTTKVEHCDVQACSLQLEKWINEIPDEARYQKRPCGVPAIDLHRAVLHLAFHAVSLHKSLLEMVCQTALSSASTAVSGAGSASGSAFMARYDARRAATFIASIAGDLDRLDLINYLPATTVSALVAAITIHLLDMRTPRQVTRESSTRNFRHCLHALRVLSYRHEVADHSIAFLEAATRFIPGAGIFNIPPTTVAGAHRAGAHGYVPSSSAITEVSTPLLSISNSAGSATPSTRLSTHVFGEELVRRLESILTADDFDEDCSSEFDRLPTDCCASPPASTSHTQVSGLSMDGDGPSMAKACAGTAVQSPESVEVNFESWLNMEEMASGPGSPWVGAGSAAGV